MVRELSGAGLRFVATFTWWAEANNTERASNLSKLVTSSTTAFTGLLSRKGRKSSTVSYTMISTKAVVQGRVWLQ